VPPWRVADSPPPTAHEVEGQLQAAIDASEEWRATNGVPVTKQALDKGRRQRAALSALVDLGWQGVGQEGEPITLTPRWTSGSAPVLLPLQDGREAGSRTAGPRRQAQLRPALAAVQTRFDAHPVTHQLQPAVLESWLAWAAAHAQASQRASAAIAGRNGSLAQMPHHHRG
jgi:Family of unknown function (DUF6399)